MASAVLYSNPQGPVRTRLNQEMQSIPLNQPLTFNHLGAMRYLGQFVMEVKRLSPILPAVFGQVKMDFEVNGVRVPAGWRVLWAVYSTNIFRQSFKDRRRFDPDRFSTPPQNPFVYVPQGGGPATGHRCGGLEYSTLLLEVFLITLLRRNISRLKNPDP